MIFEGTLPAVQHEAITLRKQSSCGDAVAIGSQGPPRLSPPRVSRRESGDRLSIGSQGPPRASPRGVLRQLPPRSASAALATAREGGAFANAPDASPRLQQLPGGWRWTMVDASSPPVRCRSISPALNHRGIEETPTPVAFHCVPSGAGVAPSPSSLARAASPIWYRSNAALISPRIASRIPSPSPRIASRIPSPTPEVNMRSPQYPASLGRDSSLQPAGTRWAIQSSVDWQPRDANALQASPDPGEAESALEPESPAPEPAPEPMQASIDTMGIIDEASKVAIESVVASLEDDQGNLSEASAVPDAQKGQQSPGDRHLSRWHGEHGLDEGISGIRMEPVRTQEPSGYTKRSSSAKSQRGRTEFSRDNQPRAPSTRTPSTRASCASSSPSRQTQEADAACPSNRKSSVAHRGPWSISPPRASSHPAGQSESPGRHFSRIQAGCQPPLVSHSKPRSRISMRSDGSAAAANSKQHNVASVNAAIRHLSACRPPRPSNSEGEVPHVAAAIEHAGTPETVRRSNPVQRSSSAPAGCGARHGPVSSGGGLPSPRVRVVCSATPSPSWPRQLRPANGIDLTAQRKAPTCSNQSRYSTPRTSPRSSLPSTAQVSLVVGCRASRSTSPASTPKPSGVSGASPVPSQLITPDAVRRRRSPPGTSQAAAPGAPCNRSTSPANHSKSSGAGRGVRASSQPNVLISAHGQPQSARPRSTSPAFPSSRSRSPQSTSHRSALSGAVPSTPQTGSANASYASKRRVYSVQARSRTPPASHVKQDAQGNGKQVATRIPKPTRSRSPSVLRGTSEAGRQAVQEVQQINQRESSMPRSQRRQSTQPLGARVKGTSAFRADACILAWLTDVLRPPTQRVRTAGEVKIETTELPGLLRLQEEIGLQDENTDVDYTKICFDEPIGTGSFGTVWRGRYCDEVIAVKQCKINDARDTEMLLGEIRCLKRLRHPRLVSFLGCCSRSSSFFLLMEFMPGGSMHELLFRKKQHLAFEEQARMACEVSEGLSYLHGLGVIHRDLKTMNIVLDDNLGCKICDFGLTLMLERSHFTVRTLQGSPRYMAPEQFEPVAKITEKVDVWQLGCVLLELFCLSVPFSHCHGVQQIATELLVRRKPPATPVDADPRARALISACLRIRAQARPAATVLEEALRKLAGV